jgi:hypothetical protein
MNTIEKTKNVSVLMNIKMLKKFIFFSAMSISVFALISILRNNFSLLPDSGDSLNKMAALFLTIAGMVHLWVLPYVAQRFFKFLLKKEGAGQSVHLIEIENHKMSISRHVIIQLALYDAALITGVAIIFITQTYLPFIFLGSFAIFRILSLRIDEQSIRQLFH